MKFSLKSTSGLPVNARNVVSSCPFSDKGAGTVSQYIDIDSLKELTDFIEDLLERKTGKDIILSKSKKTNEYFITVKDE